MEPAQPLHHGDGNGAARAAGYVVKNAGNLHGVGDGLEVKVHPFFVGLVVIGGNEEQTVSAQTFIGERLFEHRLRRVGARSGNNGDAACNALDGIFADRVVFFVRHR